jgi:hypothetical protein
MRQERERERERERARETEGEREYIWSGCVYGLVKMNTTRVSAVRRTWGLAHNLYF